MAQEQLSVADLFRRAQAIRRENPQASYKEIKEQLVKEFRETISVAAQPDDSRTGRARAGRRLVRRSADRQTRHTISGLEGNRRRNHSEPGTN